MVFADFEQSIAYVVALGIWAKEFQTRRPRHAMPERADFAALDGDIAQIEEFYLGDRPAVYACSTSFARGP